MAKDDIRMHGHNTPGMDTKRGHERYEDPVAPGDAIGAGPDGPREGDQREAEGVLALEIIVERALRHPGRGEDLLDPDGAEAFLGQDGEPRAHHPLTRRVGRAAVLGRAAALAGRGVGLVHALY